MEMDFEKQVRIFPRSTTSAAPAIEVSLFDAVRKWKDAERADAYCIELHGKRLTKAEIQKFLVRKHTRSPSHPVKILVINCGSSSLKLGVFEIGEKSTEIFKASYEKFEAGCCSIKSRRTAKRRQGKRP